MPKRRRSASFGKRSSRGRPSSRVVVFERADIPGRFFIVRSWVKGKGDAPREDPLPMGITWDGAQKVGRNAATERDARIISGRTETGEKKPVTVRELLTAYHGSAKAARWGEKHRGEQERQRKFWETRIGARYVEDVSPDEIERLAAEAAERLGWEGRGHERALQYIQTAGRWGAIKGGLFVANPWAAIDFPETPDHPGKAERIYSPEEIQLLVTPHPDIDWRCTLAASIEYDTGRRTKAIRHLWRGTAEDAFGEESDFAVLAVQLKTGEQVERLFLHFRAQYDKANQDRWVPVSDETRALVMDALERPEVTGCGWLFPEGRMDHDVARDKPISDGALIKLLVGDPKKRRKGAEEILGIKHVKRRAYHAVKRRHVTTSDEEASGDLNLVGDVTGNRSPEVLRSLYRFPEAARMVLQVDRVRARIGIASTSGNR